MKLDDLIAGELREIQKMLEKQHPYVIGKSYLIRTVTHYYTGKLVFVGPQELLLESAAWIADTGRYSNAVANGTLEEIEPIGGPVIIGRGAIVDAVEWKHPLPETRK